MLPAKEDSPLRGRIFPIPVTNVVNASKKMEFRILVDIEARNKQPLAFRQVTVVEGRNSWTENEAHSHLVNEASLALRRIVRNTNNLHNPMREWGDAFWLHKWIDDPRRGSHCVCIAFIPIEGEHLPLLHPERHIWKKMLPETRRLIWGVAELGRVTNINNSETDTLKRLLGDELMDSEPSPVRRLQKRLRFWTDKHTEGHPLGCSEEVKENELGVNQVSSQQTVYPE